MPAAAAYLGCFRRSTRDGRRALPETISEQLSAGNKTEQCWQLAAGSMYQAVPLFGVSGNTCLGGWFLSQATELGVMPESACAANRPNVRCLAGQRNASRITVLSAPSEILSAQYMQCTASHLFCCRMLFACL
jgi:hypothetical protein